MSVSLVAGRRFDIPRKTDRIHGMTEFSGRRAVRTARVAAGLFVLCAVTACGSESEDDGGGQSRPPETCKSADKFVVNVTKTGEKGVSVAIVDAKPSTPQVFVDNEWMLSVTDSAAAPIDNATITVIPWMKHSAGPCEVGDQKCGHGNGSFEGVFKGNGTYAVSKIAFNMAKVWDVRIAVSGGTSDSVTFNFCVGG